MPPSQPPSMTPEKPQTEAEKRQQRLADALRANLRRRKAQKRGRADGDQTPKSSDQHQSSGQNQKGASDNG